MINSKETLKNLHKEFPTLTLDDLFKILDCYVEENYFSFDQVTKPRIWYSTDANLENLVYDRTTTTITNSVDC